MNMKVVGNSTLDEATGSSRKPVKEGTRWGKMAMEGADSGRGRIPEGEDSGRGGGRATLMAAVQTGHGCSCTHCCGGTHSASRRHASAL